MTVTKLPVRRVPVTETQILRNRYDEAKAIKEAWDWRLRQAETRHRTAMATGGDVIAARRTMDATAIQVADAAGELRIALNNWMNASLGRRHAA